MSEATCDKCLTNNSTFTCGLCSESVCKKCVSFVNEEAFAFATHKPEVASHSAYCANCYDTQVAAEVQKYEDALEAARQVRVFFKGQGKSVRALAVKKVEAPLTIKNCPDYNECILRLAYLAAENGFNILVDIDIKSEKVRNAGYVHLIWHGTGIPANVELSRFSRTDVDPKFNHLLPY